MSTEGITRAEFLREANKRIGKSGSDLFARYGVKTHWCMMQVYYLMHDVCGISEFPKTFSCSGFTATSFAKKRLNYDFKTAEIGDIVLFELNGNRADGADHVGVVIDNTGNSIKLLEGNTGGNENGDFCGTSSTNVFEYSYTARCLDCIIDMSEFFAEKIEEKHPPDVKKEEEPQDTFSLELRVLKKGMKGRDVTMLQRLIRAEGFSIGIYGDDGDFGSATEAAVKGYQKEHKLAADGIAGKETFTSLFKS